MTRPVWPGATGAPSGGRRGRCLGADLTAYADRHLDAATLLHWDRHLVSCEACRGAVAQERRVLAALRSPSAPGVPGDLRGMLLAMASPTGDRGGQAAAPAGPLVPPVPVAPVRVVDRGAPALHRSARRSTVLAGLAAGATAAAAWSVVVSGSVVTGATPPGATPGTVQGTRPPSTGQAPAVFTVPAARFVRSGAVVRPPAAPATGTARPTSAQLAP